MKRSGKFPDQGLVDLEERRGMRWRDRFSISTHFLITSAIVLCISMAVLGTWVNHQITRSVLATSGADGAAFMRGFLEPLVQRMDAEGRLHPEDVTQLDRLFVNTVLGQSIVSAKLWVSDGGTDARIIYSSLAKDTIGEQHVSTDVQKAARGGLVSEFEDMISPESRYEQGLHKPLIEIYAPLYRSGTREVIAVGEIYEDASVLAQQLRESLILSWIVVCLTTVLMIVVLYLIVHRASLLIQEQQLALGTKVAEAEEMAALNHTLRLEADRSRLDANEANEELLGRIGLDIHDGPIQFLTLIRFKLDEITQNLAGGRRRVDRTSTEQLGELADKLSGIIDELRDLSVGLVLPELGALTLKETIELAVQRHEHLTGTHVDLVCGTMPEKAPEPLKTCVYRIVQESLSNSFKHAGGRGQQVAAGMSEGKLTLEIRDNGQPVSSAERTLKEGTKLGQRGIRNRVAAFGGALQIEPHGPHGRRVSIMIPVQVEAEAGWAAKLA